MKNIKIEVQVDKTSSWMSLTTKLALAFAGITSLAAIELYLRLKYLKDSLEETDEQTVEQS